MWLYTSNILQDKDLQAVLKIKGSILCSIKCSVKVVYMVVKTTILTSMFSGNITYFLAEFFQILYKPKKLKLEIKKNRNLSFLSVDWSNALTSPASPPSK